MRKDRLVALAIALAVFSAPYCKSGDEDPSDDQELLNLLDVGIANGIFWSGKTSNNSCSTGDPVTSVAVCATQDYLEDTYLSGDTSNLTLYLPSANPPAGTVTLVLPHPDNNAANTFNIAVSGDLKGGYETGNGISRVLTLNDSGTITASNSTVQIQMSSFRAQQGEKTVEGTVDIKYVRASASDTSYTVQYDFQLDKVY
ncbi:MAG: hypothetical protein KDK37_02880 [Leptospiraceae bacterium]|mgnify:CR=1 FL=1|nr:hypothetical protein [Leptospiraceae bacterium]MCB1303188.1 hypothetical protein [Leptospiraceae bacterium]